MADNENDDTSTNADTEVDDTGDVVELSGEADSLMKAIESISADNLPDLPEGKEAAKVPEPKVPDKVEEVKVDPVKSENDRGLERLATKEKEVREAREGFEKEKSQYIKFADLNLNPSAVLKKVGIDPDVLMKTILYEKLPDGNPVKVKLENELSKTLTDKKINALREEMAARDRAAKQAEDNNRNYQATVTTIGTYVEKFKTEANKVLPTVSLLGKEDSGVLKELIIDELINDAALRFAKGEDGDPITHEEAANRIEKRLAKLAPLIQKFANEISKGNDKPASTTGKKKPVVRPGPAQAKVQDKKTSAQELDDLISNVLSGKA
mgnify:CR=1 FL=1